MRLPRRLQPSLVLAAGGATGAGPSLLIAIALALLASCGGGDAPGRPRSAVLLTLDTTRRDALGCYGASPKVTPHLDALAAESLVFDQARTTAPITLPAHASMLTGLYPPRHGIRDNGLVPLPKAASTVAERARAGGMQTAAFVSAIVLSDAYGVQQGFESFSQPTATDGVGERGAERAGAETVANAIRWLEARDRSKPFLLWVHLFDAHGPNEPPAEHLARADGDPYLGDVALQDDAVGVLLDALRSDPEWDETLVVVVGDHGEALGEHGEPTHTAFVYDSTLRVPMLVRDPDTAPGRSDAIISVVDVFPTLVEALELGAAGDVDGISLFRRPVPEERGVYFESYHGLLYYQWSTLAGWVDAEAKYIHSAAPELYAPGEDPGELRNLLADGSRSVDGYLAELERLGEEPALAPDAETLDRDILPALADLGYAGSATARDVPGPLEVGEGPSPHARAEELRAVMIARYYAARGEYEPALAELEKALAENPRNHEALQRKGAYLMALGRLTEAVAALERFAEIGPEWPNVWVNLGKCQLALGEPKEAERWARRAIEVASRDRAALTLLVEALLREGRDEEALPYQLELIELGS